MSERPVTIGLVADFPDEPMPRDATIACVVLARVCDELARLTPDNRKRVLAAAWVFFVAHVESE
jgi:hypothetical protein